MFRITQITSLHDLNENYFNGCDFSPLNIYRNANDIRKMGKKYNLFCVYLFSQVQVFCQLQLKTNPRHLHNVFLSVLRENQLINRFRNIVAG